MFLQLRACHMLQASKTALEAQDPEVFRICQNEKDRQRKGVQLIASEVREGDIFVWVAELVDR